MKVDNPMLTTAAAALAPGRGAPIVAGEPHSVYAPLEDSLLYAYAFVLSAGALGVSLAAGWRIFGLALSL